MANYTLYWNGEISFSLGKGCVDSEIMSKKGLKERCYMITNSAFRDLIGAAIKMQHEASFALIFLTATFPFEPTELEAQTIFKNFLKNLKTNYGLKKYIWCKERQKNSRIHFHLLSEIPFVPILVLQGAFNSAIRHIKPSVNVNRHSLRLPNSKKFKNIVQDSKQVAKYIGKYMSKSRFEMWKLPCYQISKDLYPLSMKISEQNAMMLTRSYEHYIVTDKKYYAKTVLKNVTFVDILREFDVK